MLQITEKALKNRPDLTHLDQVHIAIIKSDQVKTTTDPRSQKSIVPTRKNMIREMGVTDCRKNGIGKA